ncbi:MAG: N-6 DNA methylase, partial [Chloroflexi bacterium]|nr:N-6 DNA methylase [Chloroflexota bacterium]
MTANPNVLAHLEWLGYVQPVGLVVSAQALDATGAVLNRNDTEGQRLLERCTTDRRDGAEVTRVLTSFEDYARTALGWSFHPNGFAGTAVAPVPDDLAVPLPDEGGTLAPRFAVRDLAPAEGAPPWQLVVLEFPAGIDLDKPWGATGRYDASPSSRLERLLRETGVVAGIACNGATIRLMAAPRGESSGWIDFRVDHMVTPAGRDIAAAARMLLNQQRLLTGDPAQGLLALLRASRAYQSNVSERLAGQVLGALYELVRGAQAARSARAGDPIAALVAPSPPDPEAERAGKEALYQGLLTVVMRLLFQLYAEERGLAFDDGAPTGDYAIAPLYERLREDAALHPDTMDHRYGAWAQLLALWRLTYEGCPDLGAMPRHGSLFDPGRFPFLEGRRTDTDPIAVPLIPDGTIHRVLEQLLVLDGERLSYRALDVEHIGSVYEAMMGFRIEVAGGTSVAIRGQGALGAPVTIALEDLLAQPGAARGAWLEKAAGRAPTGAALAALRAARTIDEAHGALERLIDRRATPDRVPAGALVMQPSDERRSSGSHYTPRSLTEPIVKRTLDPQLDRLRPAPGVSPTPEAILGLTVCDPAMGSGAFLVETCRYLGDALVAAWHAHGGRPTGAGRHDEVVHARRLVAQRCVYGVDRNRMAVELAKVSVWLATLARDLPLTFIDHALRHGDSLVGLTRAQVLAMDWDATATQLSWMRDRSRDALERLATARRRVREAGVEVPRETLEGWWAEAGDALAEVRLYGNLVVMAFFAADPSARARATALRAVTAAIQEGRIDEAQGAVARAAHGPMAVVPFHWEVEFPEVFDRPGGGFDAFVGNPPFAGKNTIAAANPDRYPDWLHAIHEGAHGNADLVAHFFRRSFGLLRPGGTLGLIATNTIAQGDTRASGLRWVCTHGGEIYHATRRLPWPGMAAVIVSVVHLSRGPVSGARTLDGTAVDSISAFLVPGTMHDNPSPLRANAGKSFVGSYVLGMGFTFEADAADDIGDGPPGTPTSIRRMHELLAAHPHYREVVMPYIGGEEVNSSPVHAHRRHVINFGDRSEAECRSRYPDLMA